MANYHQLDIQYLAQKMLEGNMDAKNRIIEYYTKYIDKIIESNFGNFEDDKIRIKSEMLKIMQYSINTYNRKQTEYLSHYITRKLSQYYSNETRKLKSKQEYKNREIQQLILKAINGDNEALNKIIEFYSYHIRVFAKTKYKHVNIEEDDLVQIGIIGLLKAINFYKTKQEHPFSAYANNYINRQIIKETKLRNQDPDIEYIGLTNNYTIKAFEDFIEKIEVLETIEKLSDIKKQILSLYIYGKYSFEDIANILGISYQRTHQHYKRALEIIKDQLINHTTNQKIITNQL